MKAGELLIVAGYLALIAIFGWWGALAAAAHIALLCWPSLPKR